MPDQMVRASTWLDSVAFAHRGLWDDERPENSLAAFAAAADAGYGIELDVQLTVDGVLVVCHDPSTKRMTGVDLRVTDATASEVTKLTLAGTDQHVPTLAQVLDLTKGRVPLDIEVKKGSPVRQTCTTLTKLLADYNGPVAVSSFDPSVVWWLRLHAPHIPRGQIAGPLKDHPEYPGWVRQVLMAMPQNLLTAPTFIAFDIRAMPHASVSFWRGLYGSSLLVWPVRTDTEAGLANRLEANLIFEHIRPDR